MGTLNGSRHFLSAMREVGVRVSWNELMWEVSSGVLIVRQWLVRGCFLLLL